jgi:hypothetical protein
MGHERTVSTEKIVVSAILALYHSWRSGSSENRNGVVLKYATP